MSGKISFSQDLVTNTADMFTVLNYNVRSFEPGDYRLSITGDIASDAEFTLDDLLAMEQISRKATKMCGTNSNAGTMIYNVELTGVDLMALLQELGMKESANAIVASGYDGWGFPIAMELLRKSNALLVLKFNGQDLEPRQGYPVELGIPGEGGFVWVKYLKSIEIQTVPQDQVPEPLPIMFPLNAGFLKPAINGTEVTSPVHIEGWAFNSNLSGTPTNLLLSADYGKTWNAYDIPDGDPAQWVYWKIDWTPPEPGHYLLKVKAQSGEVIQDKEDNVVVVVKE